MTEAAPPLYWATLVESLRDEFPEYRPVYDLLVEEYFGERPDAHPAFGQSFLPSFVIPMVSATDRGDPTDAGLPMPLPARGSVEATAILRRAFDFFERMGRSPDANVRDVLYATVVPRLLDHDGLEEAVKPWFGPALRVIAERVDDIGGDL